MAWYWWLLIAWPICGLIALLMNIRDNPAMQENIGIREIWPVVFGPLWLAWKGWEWTMRARMR